MQNRGRIRDAAPVALVHLGLCVLVALATAAVVFQVWYPNGLHQITGGGILFMILIMVDVVCGPVLTLILYSRNKSRVKWRIDLALIALIQTTALVYGVMQVADARPVLLAFEDDRFRLVQAFDVDMSTLQEAPSELRMISWSGPRLIGVRLAQSGDSDYLTSVQMSIQGMHPAFRPSRWLPFDEKKSRVLEQLKSLKELRLKNEGRVEDLNSEILRFDYPEEQLGYLPLVKDFVTDWVVIVNRATGVPLGYLPFDGW
jgi:hypothetical protein